MNYTIFFLKSQDAILKTKKGAIKLLRAAGAVPVIAADPDEKKRAQALKSGAGHL